MVRKQNWLAKDSNSKGSSGKCVTRKEGQQLLFVITVRAVRLAQLAVQSLTVLGQYRMQLG